MESPGKNRFAADVHLGKLATGLRLLGFDTAWSSSIDKQALAALARNEGRLLLSRDRSFEKLPGLSFLLVHSTNPDEQLQQVIAQLHLRSCLAPFTRCLSCNGLLEPVAKTAILPLLPAGTVRDFDDFRQCAACSKIYWEGRHFERMKQKIAALFSKEPDG